MRSAKRRGTTSSKKADIYHKASQKNHLVHVKNTWALGAAALFVLPMAAMAQAPAASTSEPEREVEEVVVTGSFIRNSQFTNASPVVTITQDDLWVSGAANLGEYLRSMPYMENIDTVASVLATQDGQQDSNSARFNLRGLGTESTLTLVDGRRAVNESAIAALLPGIAQRSVEIVTDGGAALYGSDAVAGVANLIPYKQYDGMKGRVYYKTDQENSSEQYTAEFLIGHRFNIGNGIEWVGAVEVNKRTAFLVSERPRYLEYYDQDSTFNNPGRWVSGAATGRTDPSCGTFNGTNTDLSQAGSFPSGEPFATGCRLHFGEWQDFGRPSQGVTLFNNFTYEVNSWLDLEFQMSHNDRTSTLVSSPSNAVTTNLTTLIVPVSHPANPFGAQVRPSAWRPFTKLGTLPSVVTSDGLGLTDYNYYAEAYKFGGQFDIVGTTWEGEAWIGQQDSLREFDGRGMRLSKMQAALRGQGGPGGNQYFNPFGSADPRSPFYRAGITSNSQEVVDWLVESVKWTDTRDKLKYFDIVFNGEVMDIPSGTVRAAVGGQVRNQKTFDFEHPLTAIRDNLYSNAIAPLTPRVDRSSGVRAIFGEIEVPILSNLGIKAAVRSEDFYTIGFSATKPKISVLWEPLDTLALRASYGESFLAPSPAQLRPLAKDVCTIVTSGVDPLTNISLDGTDSCTSGNPSLGAEESIIANVGLSWRPIDGLSIDLDYQEIEYAGRISSLVTADVTRRELNAFLASTGRTTADFRPATNPADAAAGIAWALANPNELITRDASGRVTDVYRAPINLSSQFVEGIDFRVRYAFDVGSLGNFTASLGGNYYTRWEYLPDEFSALTSGIAVQNAETNLAPPLSRYKFNTGLSWFRENNSASMTVRHAGKLRFDQTTLTERYGAFAPDFIRAITKVDARFSHRFNAFNTDSNVTFGITNLFDRDAQRLPQAGGLETRIDDPFGRQFYVSLDFDL
ncbi:MAG: TonB-dependent receptor [Pseudohongiella sp.]|nr:TonB-dependent receptor [Pseudohongiella sp.]